MNQAPAPISAVTRIDGAVEHFHTTRKDAPFWLSGKRGRATDFLSVLSTAGSHGLAPTRYMHDQLVRLAGQENLTPTERAETERMFSRSFVRFAQDLSAGAIDPAGRDWEIYLEPIRPDPLVLLRRASTARDIPALLDSFVPRDPRYKKLRAAGEALLLRARTGGWGEPVKAEALTPGERSLGVAALRRRLAAMGDLPFEPELTLEDSSSATYDERLEGAVASFQYRHGLAADGIAGPETLRAVNMSIEARIAQIMLNLERMRWWADKPLGRRIEVNLAAYQMTVYDRRSTPIHESRTIIGQSEVALQTPEFADEMTYLVINPTWNVPTSIVTREILKQAKKDPLYFQKNNMTLLRGGGEVDPDTIEWSTMTRARFRGYGVKQAPGPLNALGDVKFMFPNPYAIYLHDTPSQHLFSSQRRAYSHGCVRIERPFALAHLLLSEQAAEPGALIEELIIEGSETPIPLEQPMPIRIAYHTAFIGEGGTLNFREDVYDRDAWLARILSEETKAIHMTQATPPAN